MGKIERGGGCIDVPGLQVLPAARWSCSCCCLSPPGFDREVRVGIDFLPQQIALYIVAVGKNYGSPM